jgi:hypothetical protein
MKRFENRAEKAMRAKHKALRCAETRPESPTQEVVNLCEGERAQAEAEEMMKPVGEIVLEAGEALHVDPRDRKGRGLASLGRSAILEAKLPERRECHV